MDYLMAIDLGSTSLKAVIYDLDGNLISSASRPTEKITPEGHPEWVIWDPDQIWQGAAAASKEALSGIDDPSLVRAVAVTGMGMDGVPIDKNGDHLYPFISWHDPRTAGQADWWNENIGAEKTFGITGFPTWAITAAMRVLWMKENEPEIMEKAEKWLLIEDFLNHKLCGKIATDYSMASCMLLFDQKAHSWSDELIDASGIEKSLLPDPAPSGTVLGKISGEASALTGLSTDTTVVLGGHDHICGTLPIGVYKPGSVLDIIGTWEIISTAVPAPFLDAAISGAGICMQSHVVNNMYAAWGAAVSAESLEWFRREFGFEAEQKAEKDGVVWDHLMAWLADTKPGSSGVMFLPHISAAGCPINDDKSLGAFVGLSNTATKGDMLRAVIEGLNYQFLHIIEVMESGMDCKLDKITIAGGVAQNEFWIQNKVDMLGIPMEVSEVEEATPLGCAMLAGIGIGLYKDVDEAYERVKRPGKVIEPNKELTAQYAELFKIHKDIYPALKDLNHGIFSKFKG
ncbi:MAG: FGGY family carbohydrate kinase [Kiritimatiellia bacterium]|jgi:xylulokinase|nr:FGGY family carbohydrate kinase [Kiritimatiellia bacterium]